MTAAASTAGVQSAASWEWFPLTAWRYMVSRCTTSPCPAGTAIRVSDARKVEPMLGLLVIQQTKSQQCIDFIYQIGNDQTKAYALSQVQVRLRAA